jgi:molybdopterin molybdotransferase
VFRRPRIALLATGDEVVLPGEALPPGGIMSSNTHALAAFITAAGGDPLVLPIAGDSRDAIAAGVAAARGADLLLTAGGASVGDHDLVQTVLAGQGMRLDFWRIAMRPGKPLMFGMLGEMPVLGLPGNPVSAFVCAILFLRPAIERMSGLPGAAPPLSQAVLGAAMKENDQREDYVRARLTAPGIVNPFPVQDSGMLRTLAQSDALIRRVPFAPALPAGAPVEVIWLRDT